MKRFYIILAVLMTACQTNTPKNIDVDFDQWDSQKPGTVVAQSIREDLGNGFYDVSKSVINHSDHWEGVGHFGYLYFHRTEICKCSVDLTSISPNGVYVVYHSLTAKRLVIYNTRSKETLELSDKYIGYPKSAEWNIAGKSAIVFLSTPNDEPLEELSISLN